MDLDIGCLRPAKVENLERLAVALRVPLPVHLRGEAYCRALVRALVRAIEADRQHAVSAAKSGSSD